MNDTIRPRLRALGAALAAALACALLAAPAGAVVSTGHSGWSWAAPSPQGEDIADLAFAGNTGYAVGANGTLLRSADGGLTWAGLPSTTLRALTRVTAVGEAGFVAAGGCAVRRSVDGGATIAAVDVGGGDVGCGTAVQSAAFADPVNGLIVFANGVVLSTADGGATLARRTPVPGPPSDVVATSPLTYFATVGDAIFRTSDAGSTWTLIARAPAAVVPPFNVPVPRPLRAITFASPTVGYAVGDRGIVMKTTDGGGTWAALEGPGAGLTLMRARCADEGLCLFTTSAGTTIVRTADGGASYTQVTPSGSPIAAVAFASPARAVAAGAGGVTVVSDDGGASWRPVGASLANALSDIVARPGGVAFGWGPAAVALTADGGETWRTAGIPTPLPIRTASFLDTATGFAQDTGNTLWKTVNGGATWQVLDPGAATGPFQAIVPLSGDRVLVIGTTRIGRSTDAGATFRLVNDRALTRTRVLRGKVIRTVSGGSRVFVIGRRGILRSSDGGARWAELPLPVRGGKRPVIAAGDCAVPSTCWIVTTGSRMYRTSNLGRRWVEVTRSLGVPMRFVQRLALGRPREAFLALKPNPASPLLQGMVLRTADDGATWAPQLLEAQPIAEIDAVPGRAWALAAGTRVLTTTTGGLAGRPSALSIRARPRVLGSRPTTVVTITGRLPGARGGEQATLYASGLASRNLTVSSAGTFTALYRLRKPTTFVAQWAGDGVRDGDGTPPLVVGRPARR